MATHARQIRGQTSTDKRCAHVRRELLPALRRDRSRREGPGWRSHAEVAVIATSITRRHLDDIKPDTDNGHLVDKIQNELLPPAHALTEWIRDPSFGTIIDYAGLSRTGAEMLSPSRRLAHVDPRTRRDGSVSRDARRPACERPRLNRRGRTVGRSSRTASRLTARYCCQHQARHLARTGMLATGCSPRERAVLYDACGDDRPINLEVLSRARRRRPRGQSSERHSMAPR